MKNKWYQKLIDLLLNTGNQLFVVDSHHLFSDVNFLTAIQKYYKIHKYISDGLMVSFYYKNDTHNLIVYSDKHYETEFICRNLTSTEIKITDVFENLDSSILFELDITYYQKIYDYYNELILHNIEINNTENLILKSIWDIDIGQLHSKTENLLIALAYAIDEKEIPEKILDIISNKLSCDITNLVKNKKNFIDWLFQFLNNNYDNNIPENIQFYLYKIFQKTNVEIVQDNNQYINIFSVNKKNVSKAVQEKDLLKKIDIFKNILRNTTAAKLDLNDLDEVLHLFRLYFEIFYSLSVLDLEIEQYLDLKKIYSDFDLILSEYINTKDNYFEQLFHYPYNSKPYTVDKILDYIHYNFKNDKILLLVFDGMSFDEWYILKGILQKNDYSFSEMDVFAIIPTITEFSRYAIFSGKTPDILYKNSKNVNEKKEFITKLSEKGYNNDNIFFSHLDLKTDTVKSNKESLPIEEIIGYQFIGLICNIFDDIAHEKIITCNNKNNLYKKLQVELSSSNIAAHIASFKKNNYKIVITSDHGNIFCHGNNVKSNKNLELGKRKSIRSLLFDNENFANDMVNNYPENTYLYKNSFIPENYNIILSRSNECFASKKEFYITHGAISPEELIIPLVVIE